jgi:hypothetical protein
MSRVALGHPATARGLSCDHDRAGSASRHAIYLAPAGRAGASAMRPGPPGRVTQHEAGLVVDQLAAETERGRVVVALVRRIAVRESMDVRITRTVML